MTVLDTTESLLDLLPYSAEEMRRDLPALLEHGEMVSVKAESIDPQQRSWLIDFSIRDGDRGMTPMFLLFDAQTGGLTMPYDCLREGCSTKALDKLARAISDSLRSPNVKLSETIKGFVYDRTLLENIQGNMQEYIWERSHPGTIFAPIRGFKVIMRRYIHAMGLLPEGAVIGDAACGMGYGAKLCTRKCRQVYAIDLSERILELGRTYYDSPRTVWLHADATDLPLLTDSLDGFISMETFEHVPDPLSLLREIRRVVRPGGLMVLSTPNGGSTQRMQINNPYHVHEYSRQELQDLVAEVFTDFRILGMDNSQQFQPISESNCSELPGFLVEAR